MNTSNTVFIPKRPFKSRLMPIFAILLILAAFAFWRESPIYIIGAIYISVLCIGRMITWIRKARFEDNLVIERFLLPSRYIPYSDVIDLGVATVKIQNGSNIALHFVENADDFREMLNHALEQGNFPAEQIQGHLPKREKLLSRVSIISALISLPIGLLAGFFGPPWLRIFGPMIIILFYLLIFPIVLLYVRWTQSHK